MKIWSDIFPKKIPVFHQNLVRISEAIKASKHSSSLPSNGPFGCLFSGLMIFLDSDIQTLIGEYACVNDWKIHLSFIHQDPVQSPIKQILGKSEVWFEFNY